MPTAKPKIEWELMGDSYFSPSTTGKIATYRLKVPGGWLVVLWLPGRKSPVFVPDPVHKWEIER